MVLSPISFALRKVRGWPELPAGRDADQAHRAALGDDLADENMVEADIMPMAVIIVLSQGEVDGGQAGRRP